MKGSGGLLINEDFSLLLLSVASSSCPIFSMIHTQRALKELKPPTPLHCRILIEIHRQVY